MGSDGEWTADAMPDMHHETVIVTGANSGLGLEATRAFVRKGARVVMACRDVERAEDAKHDVMREDPEGWATVMELDLADLSSVAEFAKEFRMGHDELHVLCNNAGVMAIPREETADGFEKQFGVNHLGHFVLTGHLLDALIETSGETCVVTHSSGVHENGHIRFDDLQGERDYDPWDAYAQSKLANVLFGYELGRRLEDAGVLDVTSAVCHPGYAATNLQRRGPEKAGEKLRLWAMRAANTLFAQSAERGALPMLYAATAPDVSNGDYVGPGGFRNMRGAPEKQWSTPRSYDELLAERLWEVSEELTGVRYDLEAPVPADD